MDDRERALSDHGKPFARVPHDVNATRRLLVRLDAESEREALLRFLRTHGCDAATADGSTDVAVNDCDRVEPGLATLVALIEEWRCAARVPEARLRLGDQETVLRTET